MIYLHNSNFQTCTESRIYFNNIILMRKFLDTTNDFLSLTFRDGEYVRRSFIFRSTTDANFHIEALTTEVQAAQRR